MKEIKIFAVMATVLLCTTMVLPFGSIDALDQTEKSYAEKYVVENIPEFSYGNLIIISDGIEKNRSLELTSEIRVQNSFDSIGENDIVLIDGTTKKQKTSSKTSELHNNIDALIGNSNPIIIVDNTPELITDRANPIYATGFTDDADVFCFFYDSETGASHGHSITGQNIEESISIAYKWTNEMLEEKNSEKSSGGINFITPNGAYWNLVYTSNVTKACGNFGNLSVRSFHYLLVGGPMNTNYVMTAYQLQGEPYVPTSFWDSYIAVADMTITNDFNSRDMLTYSPLSTGGTSTHGVNMSIGTSGGNIGASWSYSVPDVVLHNRSSYANEKYDLWYDFNEHGVNKTDTHEIRPGVLTSGFLNGMWPNRLFHYLETDDYTVTFYKHRPILGSQMETFTQSVRVLIPYY